MPELKMLQEDLTQTLERARSIRSKWSGQAIPQVEEDELNRLQERGIKLQVAITDETKNIRDKDFDNLEKFANDPNYRIPRSVNPDDEGKSLVQRAGWEVKNGIVHIPTSIGQMVPMYEESVIFGAMPDHNNEDARSYYSKTRAIVQPDYRTAYVEFLRNLGRARSEATAIQMLPSHLSKALSEGSDPAGGYLVPPDMQAEVLARLGQMAVMRRLARVVSTSRDRVVFPRVLPHASASLDSIYSSGFVGGWVGETPAFSETDPGFGQFEISIKKARVATKLSNDFVADAIVDVPAWLSRNGSENLALVEDAGFINGLGTPLEPQGFLNDPGLKTVDVEGSTANTISNTTSANGSANKIINLAYALPSQYAANAEWLMKRATEGKIRQLIDGNGRPLWLAMQDSAFAGRLPPLMGSPVNNSEFMPADGTDGAKVVAYGDFSQYIIAQRAQMTTVVLRERFADTDQIGIIIMERVGGAMWNNDAIRTGIV